MKKKKSILFTGLFFNYYSGSQKYISEMALYIKKKHPDYNIQITSPYIKKEIVEHLIKNDISIVTPDNICNNMLWDIIIAAHHSIINTLLMQKIKYKKIINLILSPHINLENPVYFHKKCSLVVANSEETKQKLIKSNNVIPNKVVVLPNFLPDEFINIAPSNHQLKKIAIISNHVPSELKLLPDFLPNISVDFIGNEYIQVNVSPEFLANYDLIISIGKTVQYALGMKIPVYEYDVFGGCGYVNQENFIKEAELNFSGRATRRKLSAKEIANEIINGYSSTIKQISVLQQMAVKKFSMKNIDVLLNTIDKQPLTPKIGKLRHIVMLWLSKFSRCKNIPLNKV